GAAGSPTVQSFISPAGIAEPLARVFELYGHLITAAPVLYAGNEPAVNVTRFLTNTKNGLTGVIAALDKGRCVYLPYFSNTESLILTILQEVLPHLSPHLVFDDTFGWLSQRRYLMPSLQLLQD